MAWGKSGLSLAKMAVADMNECGLWAAPESPKQQPQRAAFRAQVGLPREPQGALPCCENKRMATHLAPGELLHSAFYRFTPLADPLAVANTLRRLAQGLGGSIVVAHEGVSGAVAGPRAQVLAFEAMLQVRQGHAGPKEAALEAALGPAQDGALVSMAFRHSACHRLPFGRLKVSVKPEIVALALPATTRPLPAPDGRDASHLSAPAWRALLAQNDVVLLDNRNHFEVRLGRFSGALDPQVHNFRDFVAYVQAHAPAWRAAGRPVAMYCTGGIRCDKTAPWLRSLGLAVWQLDGGILGYLQQQTAEAALPDAPAAGPEWQGECFVFDQRIALNAELQPTATTAEQVYDAQQPDEAWRLQRAQRLDPRNDPNG